MTEIQHDAPPIFKWFEPGRIAASGRPDGRAQLQFLADQGIRRIVSTTRVEPDYATIAELGMTCLHVPNVTQDLAALDRAVDAIAEAVRRSEPVLVH